MKIGACRDGTLKSEPNKMGMTPQHIHTISTSCAILPTMHTINSLHALSLFTPSLVPSPPQLSSSLTVQIVHYSYCSPNSALFVLQATIAVEKTGYEVNSHPLNERGTQHWQSQSLPNPTSVDSLLGIWTPSHTMPSKFLLVLVIVRK